MKVLITGASGFTGHHLIKHLLPLVDDEPQLWGISRSVPQISHPCCTYLQADLSQKDQINTIIKRVLPDAIIHLAGLNQGTLNELLQANVVNTENLLDAVRKGSPDARVLVVGSSAEYGYAGENPITEDAPFRPVGSYGISKVAEDLLAIQYHVVHGLKVAVVRPFNLIGPRQPESFICGRLTRQTAEIRVGKRDVLEISGGDSRRDYIDVRDVADAYLRLISHKNFEDRVSGNAFNIGSGKSHSISEVISEISLITDRPYLVKTPISPARELVSVQVADTTRLEYETGWKPFIPFRCSLEDMIVFLQDNNECIR